MTLSPPQPPPSSSPRHAAIQELRRGTQLAELLRQQVELIPEPNRRHAAVVNVGQISMAMESSLSILQSEMEHPFVSEVMAAPTSYRINQQWFAGSRLHKGIAFSSIDGRCLRVEER
ncbi:unnamed protein product [Miscanthus lutarioriparius]|uniref:Uncharacterized protein n=1 Tax=Miscanthus lutarioriparius TaxID=422564 RepID=A0A811RMT5_9POAL|nr:unnamed protein product [Miscanthus lutarioriparius]